MNILLKSKYLIFICLITVLFFYKNPLSDWLEGDLENIYFIYNTLLTANSIVPDVIDYPGNANFSVNSIYLKIIKIFDSSLIINLEELINHNKPKNNLNEIYFYLKILQFFYFLILAFLILKILEYLSQNKNMSFFLTLFFILSATFIDNIERYRFDIESLLFCVLTNFFLIKAYEEKRKKFFIFLSGFFLCLTFFSKLLVIPLLLIIPIIFYFRKKRLNDFIKQFFLTKDMILPFVILNICFFLIYLYFSYPIILIITNNLIYLSFYFFYIQFLNFIDAKNKYYFLFIFFLGMSTCLLFMFSQALNFQKILLVMSPFSIFNNHFSIVDNSQIVNNLSSIIFNIKFDYVQIFLLLNIFFLIIKFYPKNLFINLVILAIYFFYRFIYSIKFGVYMDIFPIFLLIVIISMNTNFRYQTHLILLLFIINLVTNFHFIKNNKFNKRIDDSLVCEVNNLTKKEFLSLKKEENFILYYTPKFADYNFLKKLC
ncbi:MAG: O-antigen polymerase [Candidatus Pelagibacter sp.]